MLPLFSDDTDAIISQISLPWHSDNFNACIITRHNSTKKFPAPYHCFDAWQMGNIWGNSMISKDTKLKLLHELMCVYFTLDRVFIEYSDIILNSDCIVPGRNNISQNERQHFILFFNETKYFCEVFSPLKGLSRCASRENQSVELDLLQTADASPCAFICLSSK